MFFAEEWGETSRAQGPWLKRAATLVTLLQKTFIDPANGSLIEQFDAAWAPVAAAGREPGCHFEWVWTLLHHRRLTGDETVGPTAERLYRFGLAHGSRSSRRHATAGL